MAEYWQKTIFNRVSEGTLDSFLVRFRGVSVLHCHGVLVWRRAVFSTGGSTTGKGWQNWQKTIFNIGTGGSTTGKGSQNWQKTIFNRISEGTLDTFLVRFRGVSVLHCHGVLVWRSIGKRLFFHRVSEGTLQFFGAISCGLWIALRTSFFFPGSAAGAAALKSGQGPPGRGIAEGVSLLSVGERGRTPCRRPTRSGQKVPRFTVFCALPIFSNFSGLVV